MTAHPHPSNKSQTTFRIVFVAVESKFSHINPYQPKQLKPVETQKIGWSTSHIANILYIYIWCACVILSINIKHDVCALEIHYIYVCVCRYRSLNSWSRVEPVVQASQAKDGRKAVALRLPGREPLQCFGGGDRWLVVLLWGLTINGGSGI